MIALKMGSLFLSFNVIKLKKNYIKSKVVEQMLIRQNKKNEITALMKDCIFVTQLQNKSHVAL